MIRTGLKKGFLAISAAAMLAACGGEQAAQSEADNEAPAEMKAQEAESLPRVAIAGLAIETSTFSPATSNEAAFKPKRGALVMQSYPFYRAGHPAMARAEYFPALTGKAIPGGIVERETYDKLLGETLERLEANLPYDGVFLDMHGAMSVEGMDDAEGDYIARVREVVGDETLISVSTDLHGMVSWRLASEADLITTYRLAPHEDALQSKLRALENLLTRLEGGGERPAYKAWIKVPILLPGEQTSTRVEPGKSLYAMVADIEAKEGVIDAGIWMGYPWSDEPRNHGVVMAYGDDRDAVVEGVEAMAERFWSVRNEFDFVAPTVTLPEALDAAIASDAKPFIISDMGDNPTAGGAGDVTWTLHELLKRKEFQSADGPELIYASIPGPDFVAKAKEIGVGGMIDATAGADVDDRHAPPVRLAGEILSIVDGDVDARTEVVVQVGSLKVIVTERRKPYHYEADFTRNGLAPREADIVMVKIGYLVPELYNMRGDWLMALTPGGVDQDLFRVPYENIERPIFPLDPDMADPDLTARLVPLSHEDD